MKIRQWGLAAALVAALAAAGGGVYAGEVLDLSGPWAFAFGQAGGAMPENFTDTIALPGTTETNRKGPENAEKRVQGLTRLYRFDGPAWYRQEVLIPDGWRGKRISLYLERTKHTRVWLDGEPCGENPMLCTPQVYALGKLAPGPHVLTVCVDNSRRPVPGEMHQMSDNTQGNWNGIIGRLELQATGDVWLDDVQAYPAADNEAVLVRVRVENATAAPLEGLLKMRVNGGAYRPAQPADVLLPCTLAPGGVMVEATLRLPGAPQWDEFTPALLSLVVSIDAATGRDSRMLRFGLRAFKTAGTQFTVNGRTTFLRGKHDGCVFPLTGHPPMDVQGWLKYFSACRDYGINHIRFHSWTPPEAAFAAADELGLFLQPELPFWGAYDEAVAAALRPEAERILQAYGNHPSFVMFALGNECSGSRAVLSNLVATLRQRDPRHLYAQGSNNFFGDPRLAAGDDYWTAFRTRRGAAGNVRGSFATVDGGNGIVQIGPPGTTNDYTAAIAGLPVPVLGHEVGQYQAFPDFTEILKYTGVFRARNLETFRDSLAAAGMEHQARDFFQCSAQLMVLGYREEVEAALRTRGFGGFQLLDLQDFPGQGTALVGVLDAFMDSKRAVSPATWRQFCAPVVLLARFPRYAWTAGETFAAGVQMAHYGEQDFANAQVVWVLSSSRGRTVARGTLAAGRIARGGLREIGTLSAPLHDVQAPDALTLELRVPGTALLNRYPLWVYPAPAARPAPAGVTLARGWAPEARAALARGERVVLVPTEEWLANSVGGGFMTDFWCWPMFRNRPGTMGLLCDAEHPALAGFPTMAHSDWQWFHIAGAARPLILDTLPKDYRPVVQVVDNFARLHRLGLVFEARVGPGRLVVCACDLLKLEAHPEARQLLASLLDYAASDRFQPAAELSAEALGKVFTRPLAPGAPATASSMQSDAYAPALALDGDPQTRWCASGPESPQWWQVDLGAPRKLDGLDILWEQERPGYGYLVEGSLDGTTWFPVSDQRQNSARGAHRFAFPAVDARHLRLAIGQLPQGCWASIREVKALAGGGE